MISILNVRESGTIGADPELYKEERKIGMPRGGQEQLSLPKLKVNKRCQVALSAQTSSLTTMLGHESQ